ncbi:MAG TPA: hypothetical protein DGR97_14470 [Gammaproteobacteria bacterium]|nr:hypothetical protein [Gammaproteobacteria bacterium]
MIVFGNSYDQGLPRWLWLWFPPLLLLVIVPLKILAPTFYKVWIDGELGLIELATPGVAIAGVIVGFLLLRRPSLLPTRRIRTWVLMVSLGCVYFAGEELSWGQHLFGWSTPAYLEEVNDQEETNLHNISSWFDQKPRMLLELWVLIGGVVWPLLHRPGATTVGSDSYWFWPTIEALPSAALAILIRLPERLKSLFDIEQLPLELRFSEPQEYYFALFLFIYLASILRRASRTH